MDRAYGAHLAYMVFFPTQSFPSTSNQLVVDQRHHFPAPAAGNYVLLLVLTSVPSFFRRPLELPSGASATAMAAILSSGTPLAQYHRRPFTSLCPGLHNELPFSVSPQSFAATARVHGRKQRRDFSRNCRAPKVVAYYGLKSPPYKLDALEPYMSQRTLEVHWSKHHRGYVESLNKQLEKNDILYGCTMDELIKVTYNNGNPLPEFNNAAQVWNHDFFWESMQPGGGDMPTLGLLQQIEKDFGSFTNFKEKFREAALTSFGSAWVWLVLKREEKCLSIVKTSNAINPLVWNHIPLISLDLWEHAYYLDYKNDKARYVDTFMDHLVSWNAALARFARAQAFVNLGEPKIPVA